MDRRHFELLWRRRILAGAIWEQKVLAEAMPRIGLEGNPYEDNVRRLTSRLIEVQKEIEDNDLD